MQLVTARLKDRNLPNGHQMFRDEIPIGKEYQVDLNAIVTLTNFCLDSGKEFPVRCIRTSNGRFLPLECLDIPAMGN